MRIVGEPEEDWTNGRPERPTTILVRINMDPELVRLTDHWRLDNKMFRYQAWEYLLALGMVKHAEMKVQERLGDSSQVDNK